MAAASPSVILENIPPNLRGNGKYTAINIIGSPTGVEVGVCFWKLHHTFPNFMVVFKHVQDRDNWVNTCQKLNDLQKIGVIVTCAWYSRDMDKIFNEVEGQARWNNFKPKGNYNNSCKMTSYMKVLQERDSKSRENQNKLMSSRVSTNTTTKKNWHNYESLNGLEDLDITRMKSTSVHKKNQNDDKNCLPAANGESRESNLSDSFAKSNILNSFKDFIYQVEDDNVASAITESWIEHINEVEEVYEDILADPTVDIQCQVDKLRKVYSWEGEDGISKDKGLELICQFLSNVEENAGSKIEGEFKKYMHSNETKFILKQDEICYIMQRNDVSIFKLWKIYHENTNYFQNYVKVNITLPEQTLDKFVGVFLGFFKERIDELSAARLLKKENRNNMNKIVNKENKSLRARNTVLQNNLKEMEITALGSKAEIVRLTSIIGKITASSMNSSDFDIDEILSNPLNDESKEIRHLKESLWNLLEKSLALGNTLKKSDLNHVNFIISDCDEVVGDVKRLRIPCECSNPVPVDAIEKYVDGNVVAVKYKPGKGKGWKNLKIMSGEVFPPSCGWSNRDYVVEVREKQSEYLGQGCVSTRGFTKRNNFLDLQGPMFPPNVGGPRIKIQPR